MRRPFWVATGVVLGVGGTLWAEQRVKRGAQQLAERLSAEQLAATARRSAGSVGSRLRGALEAGLEERARREQELWDELDPRARVLALHPREDRGGPPGRQRGLRNGH